MSRASQHAADSRTPPRHEGANRKEGKDPPLRTASPKAASLKFFPPSEDEEETNEEVSVPTKVKPLSEYEAKKLLAGSVAEKLPHEYLRVLALDTNKATASLEVDRIEAIQKIADLDHDGKTLNNLRPLQNNMKIKTIEALNGTPIVEQLNNEIDKAFEELNAKVVAVYRREKEERLKVIQAKLVKTLMNKIVPLSQGIAHSFLSANVASGTETTTKINSMKSSFGIVAVVFAFQDELFLSKLEFHLNTPRDEIFKVFHNHLEVKTDVLIQFKKRTLSENEENSRLPTAMETDTNVAADRAEEEEDDDEIATLKTNGSSRSSSHPGFEQYRELQQQQDRSHPQCRQRRW
jgi:hypothetical protein